MEDTVREILGDVLGIGKAAVNERTSPQSVPGWDSLKHIEIVTSLEEEFDIVISIEDIESMMSFPDVVAKLKGYLE
jgi:acyl carrier protein